MLVLEALTLKMTGTNTSLTCTVTGSPTPAVSLYKAGYSGEKDELEMCSGNTTKGCVTHSGDEYKVALDSTDLEVSGDYSCSAAHSYRQADGEVARKEGSEEHQVVLTKELEVVGLETNNTQLVYGSEMVVTCVVAAAPAPVGLSIKVSRRQILLNPAQILLIGMNWCLDREYSQFANIT